MNDRARNHPHLKTGAGMFPEKPAPVRRCFMCERKAKRDSVYVGAYGLCWEHDTPFSRRVASERARKQERKQAIPQKRRKRV